MKLSDVAHALRAELNGEGHLSVTRLVHPADATGPADLAVALTPDAIEALPSTKAGAVVARVGTAVPAGAALLTYAGHERMALAILTQMFDPGPAHDAGIDPQAAIAADAKIAESASIGPFSAIGARSTIGAGTVILSGATVGADVVIGSDCLIHPGVRIADRVLIGDRVTIQANAVIGADGFSFIPVRNPDGTRNPIPMPARIHSLGTVVIADDVEIGAGTTIDRATLRETRIGKGTKIDNQVQIAHNVVIGESALICGMAGIAGSVVIGNRALLAAGAGVADHLTIGEDATLAASSGTASSLPPGEIYSGTPAVAHKLNMERYVNVARLKQLYPQVDDLKKRLLALEKGNKGG